MELVSDHFLELSSLMWLLGQLVIPEEELEKYGTWVQGVLVREVGYLNTLQFGDAACLRE